MSVTCDFVADFERAAIVLKVKNLKVLGTLTNNFNPEKLDQEFMDEFGKCVLDKPNRYDELTGNTISDTTRMRLREQIAAARKGKSAELESPAQAPVEKKPSLSEKFSRTFFGKKD